MSTQPHIQPNNLYEQDFNAWALDEANKLKLKQFDSVDWSNLIEEIEDMSKREISSLENRLITLIMHLLKWQLQPEARGNSNSWEATIKQQRLKIKKLIKKMPSLKNHLEQLLSDDSVYQDAVLEAIKETSLSYAIFPSTLPYTQEQLLDDEFYPDILS